MSFVVVFKMSYYWFCFEMDAYRHYVFISYQGMPRPFVNAAFSKRFVGAGHSEEGAGQGGEGTLLRAHRARTFRGVWGHPPSEIF